MKWTTFITIKSILTLKLELKQCGISTKIKHQTQQRIQKQTPRVGWNELYDNDYKSSGFAASEASVICAHSRSTCETPKHPLSSWLCMVIHSHIYAPRDQGKHFPFGVSIKKWTILHLPYTVYAHTQIDMWLMVDLNEKCGIKLRGISTVNLTDGGTGKDFFRLHRKHLLLWKNLASQITFKQRSFLYENSSLKNSKLGHWLGYIIVCTYIQQLQKKPYPE